MAKISAEVINERLEDVLKESKSPIFKLVPELNGIEVYFKDKPDTATIEQLKNNHWRWHSTKKCWFTRKSTTALTFAVGLCELDKNNNENSCLKTQSKIPAPSLSDSFSPQTISYNMLNGNQVIGTFSITRGNQGYTISSTNNLIPCCDCFRYFSIHATACPNCGCPTSYLVEFYFRKSIEDAQLQRRREEYEQQKQEEARLQKERELEVKKRIAELKRKRDELLREREELVRKQKEAEKIRERATEIREICKSLSLSDEIITQLAKSSVDDRTLRVRVDRIRYYQLNYPELGLQASQFIMNDDIGQYVSRYAVNKRDEQVKCIGNCSICRREECVLTSRNYD